MDFYNRQRMHQALDYKTPEFIYFEKNIVLKSLIYENSISIYLFFCLDKLDHHQELI